MVSRLRREHPRLPLAVLFELPEIFRVTEKISCYVSADIRIRLRTDYGTILALGLVLLTLFFGLRVQRYGDFRGYAIGHVRTYAASVLQDAATYFKKHCRVRKNVFLCTRLEAQSSLRKQGWSHESKDVGRRMQMYALANETKYRDAEGMKSTHKEMRKYVSTSLRQPTSEK